MMPSQPQQMDAEYGAATAESLRFDRRCSERSQSGGVATAFRLSGDQFGQIHDLTLHNLSAGGLGAVCDSPIEPGTLVSVGFAQPGQLARRGCVTRCAPCGGGYAIAVQFQMGLAA